MEVTIKNISLEVAKMLSRESFAKDGVVFLKSNVDLGPGAGIAPTGKYSGFIVGADGVTISAVTYLEPEKYKGLITNHTFMGGQFYPFNISTITITAGDLILINAL